MKAACLLFVVAAASAQDLKTGEAVFSRSCANGYCHGARGVAGGAPRLAARGFDQTFIGNTVARGVPGTAMPAFTGTLSRSDLSAVIAYVASLNGLTSAGVTPTATLASLSEEATRGRDLFSDAVRGFGACSTCHEVNGIGIGVATPIASVPADVAAFRQMATPVVKTATIGKESMPALSVSNGSRTALFYDLMIGPPVLHTVDPAALTWKDSSDWKHSSVIVSYNDAELKAILEYLRSLMKQ